MTQHLFLKTLPLTFYPLLQRINMVGNVYLACIFIVLQVVFITCILPVNMSVKARERIIKLYEFFNILRHRRLTAPTNALPKSASKAITPNVTLRAVRE